MTEQIKYENGSYLVYNEFTSDGNAKTLILPYGTYAIVEVKTPFGYKTGAPTKITVNAATNNPLAIINLTNEATGSLTLSKVDFDTRAKLAGAVFEVFYKFPNGYMSIGEMRAVADGLYTMTDLPIGDYYVIEKTAPIGYILNIQEYYFRVTGQHDPTLFRDSEMTDPLSANEIPNTKEPDDGDPDDNGGGDITNHIPPTI